MRLDKYCLSEDMIRVGFFGSSPIRYSSMRLSGPVLGLGAFRRTSTGVTAAAQALDEGLLIGNGKWNGMIPSQLYTKDKDRESLKGTLCEMIHAFLTYSPWLEIRRDETGLGVYFADNWPAGKPSGEKDPDGSWRPGHRVSFRGPIAAVDGHSTAYDSNLNGYRPYEFLGLSAFINHSCIEHAHFKLVDNSRGFFDPLE